MWARRVQVTQVLCAEGSERLHCTRNRRVPFLVPLVRAQTKCEATGGQVAVISSTNLQDALNEFGHICVEPVFGYLGIASLRSHLRSSLKNFSAMARCARHVHLVLFPRFISCPAHGEHVLGGC